MPRHKYGAKPTEVDGIRFASKKEAKRYSELKLLLQAGEISDLTLQPSFPILVNGKKVCKVILDFSYRPRQVDRHVVIYEDVKGMDNDYSRLKRKLVEAQYGIEVNLL